MKLLLAFVFSLLLLSGTVSATESSSTCIDANTKHELVTNAGVVVWNETKDCGDMGCFLGECKTSRDATPLLAIALIFAGICGSMVFIAMNFSKDSPARILSWLFISVALVLGTVPVFLAVEGGFFGDTGNALLSMSGYGVIIVIVVTIAVFLIMIVVSGFNRVFPYSKRLKANDYEQQET